MKILALFVFCVLAHAEQLQSLDGVFVVGSESDDVHIRVIDAADMKRLTDAERQASEASAKLEALKLEIRKKHGDSTFSGVRHAICGAVDRVVEIKGRFAIVTKRYSNDCPTITLTN